MTKGHNSFFVARRALLLLAALALAGCETTGTGAGPTAQAIDAGPPQPPMTHSRAAQECWMSTEKGAGSQNLDKRADFVTKCIEDKMKAADAAPKG
jgi:predicted small secreted protein